MRTVTLSSFLILLTIISAYAWSHGKVAVGSNFLIDLSANHLTDLSGNRLKTP